MPSNRLARHVLSGGAVLPRPFLLTLAVLLPLEAQAAPVPPSADPPQATTMSLDEALAYASKNQPSLGAARARLEAARQQASIARAEWLPRIGGIAELVGSTANSSSTTQITTSVMDVPRIGGTQVSQPPSWQPYASTFVGVGVRQQIFDFGRIAAEASVADALAAVEGARTEASKLQIAYAVTQAYYAVLAARAVLEASHEAYQRSKVHADFADAAVAAGVRPPIERTRSRADLTRFEVGQIRATAGLHIARSVLAAAIGADAAEIDAREEPVAEMRLPDASSIEQRVRDHSPELAAAGAVLEAQKKRARAAHAQMRPSLFLSAGVSARAGGAPPASGAAARHDGWVPEVPNYDVGLVLSWPIWDPVVHARGRAQEARIEVAQRELQAVRVDTLHAAQQQLQRAFSAEQALLALQRATDAAKANAEQAETRFRAGLGTATELADAEALRVQSEIELASGRFQLMTARAALARVLAEGP